MQRIQRKMGRFKKDIFLAISFYYGESEKEKFPERQWPVIWITDSAKMPQPTNQLARENSCPSIGEVVTQLQLMAAM